MYRPVNHGYIETVIGPMYSGKSEELIRRLKRAKIAKQNIVVFKPQIDDRYSKEDVVSHSGDSIKAIPISDSNQIYDHIDEKTQVVGIDEVQFLKLEASDQVWADAVLKEAAENDRIKNQEKIKQQLRDRNFDIRLNCKQLAKRYQELWRGVN